MEQSLSTRCFTQDRKYFYIAFLEFARRCPEMKASLYVPRNDLPLLANEECFSIVCDLLDFCSYGRLALKGMMPQLFQYLRENRKSRSNPVLCQEQSVASCTDFHPDAA